MDVSGDPTHYWETLRQAWKDRRTFVVVEHDVEIESDTLEVFDKCRSFWCGFATALSSSGFRAAFGCTRFREELMIEFPQTLDLVGAISDDGLPRQVYQRLDTRMARVMHDNFGIVQHEHFPPLRHHNDGQNFNLPQEDVDRYPDAVVRNG